MRVAEMIQSEMVDSVKEAPGHLSSRFKPPQSSRDGFI